jgi:hypothetical protein
MVHGSDGVEHYVLPATPDRAHRRSGCRHRKKPAVPVSANANFWIKDFIYRSLPAYLPLEHPYALASDKSRVGYRGSILARLQRRLGLPFPLYV